MRSQRHMLYVQGVDSAGNFYTNAKHNGSTSKVVNGAAEGVAVVDFYGYTGVGKIKYIDVTVNGTAYTILATPSKDYETPQAMASAMAASVNGHATIGSLVNATANDSAVHMTINSTTNGDYVTVTDIRDVP